MRVSQGDAHAKRTFEIFAHRLGQFLTPYIKAFRAHLLIIGGGIAEAWYLFENELKRTLEESCQVEVYISLSQGKSICLGAAHQHLSSASATARTLCRKTQQNLLPVTKTIDTTQYDLYPCHEIPIGHIGVGHRQLSEKIRHLIGENRIVLIDGFVGTHFDEFAQQLLASYHKQHVASPSLLVYDTRTFLRVDNNPQHQACLRSSTSIFGRLDADLEFKKDFIDAQKLAYLQQNLSFPCVVIGPGASFVDETSPLIYIDLAKNELYYRIAAKSSSSYLKPAQNIDHEPLSKTTGDDDSYELTASAYEQKCLYFLDYPIFNKLKQELLPRMAIFVDGQRPCCPTWLDGDTFRQALAHIVYEPVRVRPWFEAGPWGGQWLKSACKNLSPHPQNYAWSFEMITPENGLLLTDARRHLVEVSWDLFYGSQANQILGNDTHHRLFSGANDFPIRFDFLDTIDGGNLSVQCHPNLQYMRSNFGEKITQDETYYILETKQHWKDDCRTDPDASSYVYLGFPRSCQSRRIPSSPAFLVVDKNNR